MATEKLTQKFVNQISLKEGCHKADWHDTDCKGLLLEVRPTQKAYHLRFKDKRGDQRQRKLGRADVLTLKDARALAREKLRDLALGNDPFEPEHDLKAVPTVQQFVQDTYLPHVKGYKRSWKTDECLLRNHILPAIGSKYMDEVTRSDMISLFSQHRENHMPGSTNRIIILSRYLFNLAIRWEVSGVTKNPTHEIPLHQENNQRERYLSQDEAMSLFRELEESPNTSLKHIVALLLLTGARKREVLDAKWEDFDTEQRLWRVNETKAGKARHIPISDALLTLLDHMRPKMKGQWVFPNPKTGKPYVSVFNAWNTARKNAGLADVRMHDLRHSFASYLINSGRSLYEVQKILGHTQVKTTQRYAHLSQDSLKSAANEAAKAVPLIDALPKSTDSVELVQISSGGCS